MSTSTITGVNLASTSQGESIVEQSYDAMPYESNAFYASSPEHISAIAQLFGIQTPDPKHARVLELGCAAGGNLIPQALRNPQAQYVGVDLSGVQVRQGQEKIQKLGLTNIVLHHLSISDIPPDCGEFDYILCHGVYSWVPPEVQEAIMRVAKRHLSPQGLAWISYNTYPGWKFKEIVRDAMRLGAANHPEPMEQLAQARALVQFLQKVTPDGSLVHKLVQTEGVIVEKSNAYYLVHEYLEPFNAPCYFEDFYRKAQSHGLQYLAESDVHTMFAQRLGATVAQTLLKHCQNQMSLEQHLDFVTNRTFRQSMMVHTEQAANIRYALDAGRLQALHYCTNLMPKDGANISVENLRDQSTQAFANTAGMSANVSSPVQKAALLALGAHAPSTMSFAQLRTAVQEVLGSLPPDADQQLLHLISFLIQNGMLRLRTTPMVLALHVEPKPLAIASAQREAKLHRDDPIVRPLANAWHESQPASVLDLHLLAVLNGENDLAALIDQVVDLTLQGRLHMHRDQVLLTDAQQIRQIAEQIVPERLRWLQSTGFLLRQEAPNTSNAPSQAQG